MESLQRLLDSSKSRQFFRVGDVRSAINKSDEPTNASQLSDLVRLLLEHENRSHIHRSDINRVIK